jgi:hypothetical protein
MKKVLLISIIAILFSMTLIKESYAIPSFARKYKTSCATCHYAFPMLNAFGKAFMNNGFRWPGGDENFIKEEPVSLGSDGNKKAFPDAIWPGDIPGTVPLSIYATGQITYASNNDIKWGFEIPNYLNLLFGATIGNKFSAFGETEISNVNNSWSVGFAGFVQWDQSPGLHIKGGEVRADPTPRDIKLTTSEYNIESLTSRNGWSFGDSEFGLELWGALSGIKNLGGLTYRFGVVNGQGLTSTKPQKDFCGKVTYKFGGLSETGVIKGVKTSSTRPYIDNSLTVGGFFYKGTEAMTGVNNEDLSVFGADAELWFDRFILSGSSMWMNSDQNDSTNHNTNRKSLAYYLQASGLVYPWLIGYVRYESTNIDTKNSVIKPQTSIIPGIVILLRANIKLTLEAKKYLDDSDKKNTAFNTKISFGI